MEPVDDKVGHDGLDLDRIVPYRRPRWRTVVNVVVVNGIIQESIQYAT